MSKLNTFFSRVMSIDTVQRQSITTFIWQIAITFIGFFSTVYIVRTAGTNVLGGYFILLAYLGIIGMISDGGFGGAAIKRISEGEEPDAYFSAFLVLRSVYITLTIIAIIVFRDYFVDLNNTGTFYWFLLALIIYLLHGATLIGIIGSGKIGINATAGFINNVSRIVIQVVAVFLGYGFAGLAGGFIIGMLVGFLIHLRFFDLHLVHFGWKHIKSLLTFSLWVFLISSGITVFSTSDTIMIGYYLNNNDVSVYRIVLQLTTLASFTSIALISTLYPKVSRWGKTGETTLIEKSLTHAFTYSFILVAPMVAGGVLLGDKLLYYFYGSEFIEGYMTLLLLFIVQIISVFSVFFSSYLTALEHLKTLFKITMIAAITNIALNALLIPIIGIAGAAIATLVTIGINTSLSWIVISKIIKVDVNVKSLLNILKATAIMSFFVGIYRTFIPLTDIWLTLIPVGFGVIIYSILVLKFDRTAFEELNKIMTQMNIMLPKWL